MHSWISKTVAVATAAALLVPSSHLSFAQEPSSGQVGTTQSGDFVLKTNSELVLTNVVARDAKTGQFVRGLKQSDFSIYEAGKSQQITTFDYQSVDMATPLNEATVSGLA